MQATIATDQLESFNPATGELVGSVPITAPEDVQGVVDSVASLQPAWGALPLSERGRYLQRAAQLLLEDADEIRDLIVREQGKPRNEAFAMEILPTVDALNWIAGAGAEILADEKVPMPQAFLKTKRSTFVYEPLGVIAVISPWNYPWSIPLGEVALALIAGNGVVLKPASLTPLIGERVASLFSRAGVPDGLVRVVHGPGTGAALAESSVGKVFFTGSVETGRSVAEACARRLKGSVLELGGKDPMIVLEDAHLEHAIAGAVWGGFANAGQTCSGIERVYVMRGVSERFIAGVVEGAQRLRVGDPIGWETEIGPMTSEEQFTIVRELVDDAVAAGAVLHCGGAVDAPAGLEGVFYAPAVLTGVTPDMRIMREEIFGPVVPIVVVDSEAEAVALANDSDFGLGASVWTADRSRGERIAAQLESGMVWINDHMFSHGACQCSWGGVKDSGLGRTHSKFGLYECVNVKLRVWEGSPLRDPWWHPYDETLGRALRQSAKLLYGPAGARGRALVDGAVPLTRLGARLARDAIRR
ncbi:MAG TPA: aldehyde dehydrogenase family protein [Solirubrobacteraceae bacterium]|nr:aldehyde dehydrogenase family protein [Solirubrobacteraceae bacterium]